MNDLSPSSMHTPISQYGQQSESSFAASHPCYPASPQSEHTSMEQTAQGLGIFDCPMPQHQSTVQELPPSPQPSDSWSHSSVMETQEYPQTSQQPPDISSPAFDPFSTYFHQNPHNQPITSSSPEAPGLVFCPTPSHRNSVSSAYSPSAESYSQHGSEYYTPKVKMEDGRDWYPTPGNEHVLQRQQLSAQGMSPYSTGVSPIPGPAEDQYKNVAPAHFPLSFPHVPGEETRSPFEAAPLVPSAPHSRKKRQRTTPEEATHECRKCGKLFKRSYNWKSHMETHNPERKYPHPCTALVGSQPCTKKFQRKTDLDRHYESVHLKTKNHRCGLCGNRFARRDTLRRHTEDGCPKRYEMGFRDTSTGPGAGPSPAAAPSRWTPLPPFTPPKRSYSLGCTYPAGPPSSMAPPLSTMSAHPPHPLPSFDRPTFVSSPLQATPAIYAS